MSEPTGPETANSDLPCSVRTGTIFGAAVGLIAGPVVGASICLMSGQWDSMPYAILAGMLVGPLPGAFLGNVERTLRKEHTQPFVGTAVCIAFGIASVSAFIGLPMLGAIAGALLDRAFDEYRRQSFVSALFFAGLGVAACGGCVYAIDAAAYGPAPEDIRDDVRYAIELGWDWNPDNENSPHIEILSLTRNTRKSYLGTAKATYEDETGLLKLDVSVRGEIVDVSWTTEPFPDAEEQ